MKKLLSILSLLVGLTLNAQSPYVSKDTTIGGWLARITYVPGYSGQSNVFIIMHGKDEVGTTTNYAQLYGPHYWMNNGWPGYVTMGNGDHCPVYAYIQPPATFRTPTTVGPVVDAVKTRFNAAKTFGVAFSMGGWEHDVTATYKANATDTSYYSKFDLIISIEGMTSSGNTYGSMLPFPNRFGNMAHVHGTKYIGFEQIGDTRDIWKRTNNIIDSVGTGQSWFMWSNFDGGGHTGFNHFYDPNEKNWTSTNANLVATHNSIASNFLPGGINIYQAALRLAGDTTKDYIIGGASGGNVPPIADAGLDTTIILPVDSVVLNGSNSTDNDGTISSYSWVKVSGPGTTSMPNPNNASVTASNLQQGTYVFQLTVTDNDGATGTDNVTVTVNAASTAYDYMQKNVNPCRVGTPHVFTLTLPSNGAQIYKPYVTRDNLFGEIPLGNDVIKLVASSPYDTASLVELGDFGGGPDCPIKIITDSVFNFKAFRLGARDSNIVTNSVLYGDSNYATKGIFYGLRADQHYKPQIKGTIGITLNLTHDIEIRGTVIRNCQNAILAKTYGSPSNYIKQRGHFVFSNLNFHDNYFGDCYGEVIYGGSTDRSGLLQTQDSSTAPPEAAHIVVDRNIFNGAGWDGCQISNSDSTNEISNNVFYRTGFLNQSSQQNSFFFGEHTSGSIHHNASYNSTGGAAIFGYKTVDFYNNYIDSVDNGKATADGVYVNMNIAGTDPPYDSLLVLDHDNIIGKTSRYAIYHANTSGLMKPGAIQSNISTVAGAQFVSNVAGANINGNVADPNFNLSTISMDSYKILQLVRQYPDSLFSFNVLNVVNQAPVVTASYSIQNGVYQLNGTAIDNDGLIVSKNWSYLYGPSIPTFQYATEFNTTITGLVAGDYGFRFSATDDKGAINFRDIEFTVTPVTRSQSKVFIYKHLNP